jgi:hypothetical protein
MSKMLKTSAENRKCTFPNCTRILSIYNHDTYCHVHQGQVHQGHSEQRIADSVQRIAFRT